MKALSIDAHCTMSRRGSLLFDADTFIPSPGLLLNRLARRILNGALRPRDHYFLRRALRTALGDRKLAFGLFRLHTPGRPEAVYWAYHRLLASPVDLPTPERPGSILPIPPLHSELSPGLSPLAILLGPEPSKEGGSRTPGLGTASSGKGPSSLSPPKFPPGWDVNQAEGAPSPSATPGVQPETVTSTWPAFTKKWWQHIDRKYFCPQCGTSVTGYASFQSNQYRKAGVYCGYGHKVHLEVEVVQI